eukprot:8037133-Lingulodinium_polyedra.AAC.1
MVPTPGSGSLPSCGPASSRGPGAARSPRGRFPFTVRWRTTQRGASRSGTASVTPPRRRRAAQ